MTDFDFEVTERLHIVDGLRRTWFASCPPCAHHDNAWTSPDGHDSRGEAVIDYSRHLRDHHAPPRRDSPTT